MTYREIALIIGCIALFFFFFVWMLLLQIQNTRQRQREQDILQGIQTANKKPSSTLYIALSKYGFFKNRTEALQEKLNEVMDTEQTPESIIKFQMMSLIIGLSVTALIQLVFGAWFLTIISLIITIVAVFLKDFELNRRIKKKYRQFDKCLPQYEQNLLLGLQAGAGLETAMEMAIRTLPNTLIQYEFQMLLNDSNMYTDDIARPYINLSKRIPTKDCERFVNIIISGLKNGNSMSDILEQESSYMSQQEINRIKEYAETHSTQATAIQAVCIFTPVIILFIAPMMARSA